MELIVVDVPLEAPDSEYILAAISDVHVGARDFDREGFKRYIKWIESEPKAIPIIIGDLAEHISSSDKRWDARSVDQTYPPKALAHLPHYELDDFVKLIKPIANRIVLIGMGNHELKLGTRGEFDPHYELLKVMGGSTNDGGNPQKVRLDRNLLRTTPPADGNYEGFLKLRFKKNGKIVCSTKIYYHHGAKGGSPSSVTSYLDKLLSDYPVDIAMVGHGHRIAVHERCKIKPSHKWVEIETRSSIAVMHGAWKRGWGPGYTTYESKSGYTPRILGPVLIRIQPTKKIWKAVLGDRPWESIS